MNLTELVKSKTFWAGVSAIVGTVALVGQGTMTWNQAIMPILTSIIGIFLKDALVSQTKTLQPPPA